MKAFAILALGSILTLTACNKKSDLPQYKVEEAILEVYKYRANNPDSLQTYLDGVQAAAVMAPVKQYGPIDVYNVEKVSTLEDGDKTVYEAVYKVSFQNAEGTETFKVKRSSKLHGVVVGYANDIKPLSQEKTDSVSASN